MTRPKTPFSDKNKVRHFRLVHRPVDDVHGDSVASLHFDDMYEEYRPGKGPVKLPKVSRTNHAEEEEMVDLDAMFETYDGIVKSSMQNEVDPEEFVDVENDDEHDHVRAAQNQDQVGEAARYGILFDDRNYDYMRHLRAVGVTPGAVFIDASSGRKVSEVSATKSAPAFFFKDDAEEVATVEASKTEANVELTAPELDEARERALQRYRELMKQDCADPVLREVLEALEDDAYVTEDFEDNLVLSLDNLNLNPRAQEMDDGFDLDNISEEMVDIEEDELDNILAEYDEDYEEDGYDVLAEDSFVDIEQQDGNEDVSVSYSEYEEALGEDMEEAEEELELTEEQKQAVSYLLDQGRQRKTSVYERRVRHANPNLPPLAIALAQYAEVRREMLPRNYEAIVAKYLGEEHGEETERSELVARERLVAQMLQEANERQIMKHSNIASVVLDKREVKRPVVIDSRPRSEAKRAGQGSRPEPEAVEEEARDRVNRGAARRAEETPEEKKQRKAAIKAEKREKRQAKK